QIVRLEWMPKRQGLTVTKLEQGKLEQGRPEQRRPEPAKVEPPRIEPSRPEPAQPAAQQPALQPPDPGEIATVLKRAEEFLKFGDIAAARLSLRRAAAAGNAQAALALGMTFDPAVLAEQGVLGLAPDVAQARTWYQRATELGSVEAPRRL